MSTTKQPEAGLTPAQITDEILGIFEGAKTTFRKLREIEHLIAARLRAQADEITALRAALEQIAQLADVSETPNQSRLATFKIADKARAALAAGKGAL